MDPQELTNADIANLQILLDNKALNPNQLKEASAKDNDILNFSQYDYLDGIPLNESQESENIAVSQTMNVAPLIIYPEENGESLPAPDPYSFESNDLKNQQTCNFSNIQYKEVNGQKEFAHQYTLLRHVPTHTDERKFQCLTCGKSFRQMSTLSQHRAIHSSDRPYTCKFCNKTFNRVSTLISHTRTHNGVKPHQCHLCDKAFHQKGNLRNHIFTHTNARPYHCDVCNKGFNQMSNLMVHKSKLHKNSTNVISTWNCKSCGMKFETRVALKQHEQEKHKAENKTIAKCNDYESAVIVDPIKTEAMSAALASGSIPFVLLRPLSGIPVLVRVFPAGDKQMLVPATVEDLKKHGQISVKPKEANTSESDKENSAKGCIVQIKVPVVATVIQKSGGLNEPLSMKVLSPGPAAALNQNDVHLTDNGFMYTSTFTDNMLQPNGKSNLIDTEPFSYDLKFDNLNDALTNSNSKNETPNALTMNQVEFKFEFPQDTQYNMGFALDEGQTEYDMISFNN